MQGQSQMLHTALQDSGHARAGRDRPDRRGGSAPLGADTPAALEALLAQARDVSYAAHEALYHQGSASDTVYFTTAGFLKLIIHLPNGRARIVRLHRPGAILCLNGLFSQRTEHSAVAITAVGALCLPLGTVQRLRCDDPAAYARLLERWYCDLRDADTWIAQFSTGPIRSRVARLLSFLAKQEADAPDAANLRVRLLNCEEMGCILGVTGESVSRVLAEFKRRRILADHGGAANRIYAPDLERLRHIADE